MKKERFATSIEIYNRIRWDIRFDQSEYIIGYQTRTGDLKEKAFLAWDSEGDIPWHRVRYFRQGERLVWDRESRIDRISKTPKESSSPPLPQTQPPPAASPLSPESLASEGGPSTASLDGGTEAEIEAEAEAEADADADAPWNVGQNEGRGKHLPTWIFDPKKGRWIEDLRMHDSLSAPEDRPKKPSSKDDKDGKDGKDGKPSKQDESKPRSLRVLSLNVLFDRYEADKIYTDKRRHVLFQMLSTTSADLVALQEVTPSFLEALLEEGWVQERYVLSDGPDARTVQYGGQILLSRYPIRVSCFDFSSRKRMILAEMDTPVPMRIAVVHLTSELARDAEEKRTKQLATVFSLLQKADHALLLGDFNLRHDQKEVDFQNAGMLDLWPALRPEDDGSTYLPSRNTLAALLSKSGESGRYDRIFLRSKDSKLTPTSIRLFGEEPFEGDRYISDHFGLLAELALQNPLHLHRPTVQSAFAVLLPEALYTPIQDIRRDHDPSFRRWMPHINLIYPFVPEDAFPDATAALQAIASQHPAFPVTLASFDCFTHKASSSVWLKPLSEGKLEAFQAAIEGLFPPCLEDSHRSEKGFVPHMTVAKFPAKQRREQERLTRTWAEAWKPLSFIVREIALISRRDDQPFEIRSVVRLQEADGVAEALRSEVEGLALSKALAETNLQTLQALAAPEARLVAFGSRFLDIDLPGSDLDLVALSPQTQAATLRLLAERLRLDTNAKAIHLAEDALIPVLRLTYRDQRVDILAAHLPEAWDLTASAFPSWRSEIEPLSQKALEGIFGAEVLLDRLCSIESLDAFQIAARFLKVWAKKRAVSSTAWGFWGGFSWAVALVWACQDLHREGRERRPSSILRHFFSAMASWPWPHPLSIDTQAPFSDKGHKPEPPLFLEEESRKTRARAELMPVLHPLPPHEITTRAILRSTAALLTEEFIRAATLLEKEKDPWPLLLHDLEPPKEGSRSIVLLELSWDDPSDPSQAQGWLDRKIAGLLVALEALFGPSLRPDPRPLPPKGTDPANGLPPSNLLRFAIRLPVASLSDDDKAKIKALLQEAATSAPPSVHLRASFAL